MTRESQRAPFLNDALAYAIANGYGHESGRRALSELQAIDRSNWRAYVCRASVGEECMAPNCPCAETEVAS